MNDTPRYFVPVLIALSFLTVGCLHAAPSVEVESNMLLWKKGFVYRTQVNAGISLTNTKIEVDESGRKAKGEQDRSFYYHGRMAYNTEIDVPSGYNGAAKRNYEVCDMKKGESDPLSLKGEVGFWDVWKSRASEYILREGALPAEWEGKFDVVERNAEVGGVSYIILRQKPDSPNLLGGGDLELAFESMGALSRQWFLFEWTTPRSFGKATVTVTPAKIEQGRLVKTTDGVSKIVKEVIARESKLLYEAMLGSDSNREDGETWIVEGEALEAMIHPTVEGRFRGRALVKAEVVNGASPVRTVSEMNGLKLKFVRSGLVDGKNITTDLALVFGTVDGGEHTTKLVPDDGVFSGEIWLDTENQTVRYGRLKVDTAKYDGYLPKIGELNAKVKLKADLDFELEYLQSITPAEEQTVGE